MLRFYAKSFAKMLSCLERSESLLLLSLSGRADFLPEAVEGFPKEMASAFDSMEGLLLSFVVKAQAERLKGDVATCSVEDTGQRRVLLRMVQELKINIATDLGQHLFLCIPESDKTLYSEPQKWFGEATITKFQEAWPPIRDCVQCLALDQPTAAVAHAMAVCEYGIRWLATDLEVPFTAKPIELENWQNIIEPIEKEIRKRAAGGAKSFADDEERQFYSEAVSHFFYIKNAWRNHISHGKGRYGNTEAREIVEHVRGLMGVLARRVQ
jgi:hypothetical protein